MQNNGYIYHDRITSREAGATLLGFYSGRYRHTPGEEWLTHILAGRIECNGAVSCDPDTVLRAGDRLAWHRPPWEEADVPSEAPVLAEGEGWLVLDKPSGLPVLPGGGFLENTLLHLARMRHGEMMAPLHRLGRGTSGAILFTREAGAARILSRAMREGRISKTYLALVQGLPREDVFTVDAPIGPVPYGPLGTLHAVAAAGKASVSHCRVLRRDPASGTSLLAVDIPTGRPHQIRIHCAAAGHPLAGDPLYGPGGLPLDGDAVPGDLGYLLHSWRLRFPDPSGTGIVAVTAPPPASLAPPERDV